MNTNRLLLCGLLCSMSAGTQAATTFYSSSTDFNLALSGAATTSQDFESYAHLTPLAGVSLLPGVSVTGNFSDIDAWSLSSPNTTLFGHDGTTRSAGNAYYDISFSSNYNAFAFDIMSYDPDAAINGQHGVLEVFTTTGNVSFDLTQTGASEQDPIFVGLITDGSFISMRWNEGPEYYGTGNEETSLDNMVVANVPAVPVPAALPLMISGMLAMGLLGRRKRS